MQLVTLKRTRAIVLVGALLVTMLPTAAQAGGTFTDDDGNIHEADIEYIAALGVTFGCNPPANDKFCSDRSVSREEMASFMVRALGVTAP